MISIIVCTYNRERFLPETLRRLAAQNYDGSWELILIDNASTDSTPDIWQSFIAAHPSEHFRRVVESTQGLSHARNRGIQEAKGEWLVFLDDDSFVSPDYLTELKKYIQTIPDMDAFGGRIYPLFESGKEPDWYCRWNRTWVSAIDMGNDVKIFEGKAYPIGANMGVSRRMAKACGDFNPNLGRTGKNMMAGEEKDYFQRIKALGGHIYYLPNIALQHVIPPSRTSWDFIARYADGVGLSERARTKGNGTYPRRVMAEGIKWGASIVLWLTYLLTGQMAKGYSLILFRYHVTKELLRKS